MTTPNPYGAPAPGSYPPPHQPSAASPGYGPATPPGPPASGTPAALGRRAIAYVIDIAAIALLVTVWLIVGAVIASSTDEPVVFLVFAIVAWLIAISWIFVYSGLQGGAGSIGMRIMKLKLMRVETGRPLGFGKALLRNIVWGAAASIVVGYFSVLFDKSGRNQGWHDKAVNAFMADVSRESAGAAASASVPPVSVPPVSPVAPAYGGGAGSAFPTYSSGSPEPVAPPAATVFPAPAMPAPPAQSYVGGQLPQRPPLPEPVAPPAPPAPPTAPFVPPAPAVAVPAPAVGVPIPPVDDGLIAFVPGVTQDPPPPPAPTGVGAPGPRKPSIDTLLTEMRGEPVAGPTLDEDDIDGVTVLVRKPKPVAHPEPEADLEDTRLVVRTRPAVFEWDDSTQHTVTSRAVFGRNPASSEGVEAIVVRDETLSLSKTHFEIQVAGDEVTVIDQHSTNGVTVVRAGERITAEAGVAVALQEGDALEIGDRIMTYKGRR